MHSETESTKEELALLRAAERAARAARERGRPQWLRWRFRDGAGRDPLALLAAKPAPGASDEDRFYWEHPSSGRGFCTIGALAAIESGGASRFVDCARRVRDWTQDLHEAGECDSRAPVAVGGFAFEDRSRSGRAGRDEWEGFPAARLVLPRAALERRDGESFGEVRVAVGPNAEAADTLRELLRRRGELLEMADRGACGGASAPASGFRAVAEESFDSFRSRVRGAVSAIRRAELEKVVLARSIRIEHDDSGAGVRLATALRHAYPSCVSFGIARGEALFLGASPERLVALQGDRVAASALAGSVARGRDPDEDALRIRSLRESKKEQQEHAVVVRAIRERLRPFCGSLVGPEAPRVLELEGIAHLETPLRGELLGSEGAGILDLVAALHPTPAVAGAPRSAARDWIRDREDLDRGWYASPVGYVDAAGGGEFRVALRCGLLRPGATRLFAGAGIVEGSDPAAELEETRVKVRALLNPLLEV